MTAQAAAGPTAPDTEAAVFLYGIVAADRALPGLAGLDGAPVRTVAHGRLAAVVSDVALDRGTSRRADLLVYSTVLEELANGGAVLPVSFGTALPDEEVVVAEVLAPQEERLADLLAELDGLHQYNLRAEYVEETVLAEIVAGDEEVRSLRERTRDLPEEAAYGERVRLGELVARALEVRGAEDAATLMEAVVPHVAEHLSRSEPGGAGPILDVALLVEDDRAEQMVQRLEELAEAVHERIRLRLVGPLPPYDFVGEV